MNRSNIVDQLNNKLNSEVSALMESLRLEEERNSNIYYDDSVDKWSVSSKVNSYMASQGYPLNRLAGIIRIKGAPIHAEMHLYELNSEDRRIVGSVKPGVRVFRYATETTVAGGITPLIAYNMNRNLVHVLDQDAADNGETKFESRGERVQFARFLDKYQP